MHWMRLRRPRRHDRAARSWQAAPVVERLEERRLLSADVLTYHNDNARDGVNSAETTLTTSNVNSTDFGKLFSYPVDGYVYAQPLIVSNLAMSDNTTHDVVFVATENDSVYAFDADSNAGSNQSPLWHDSFIDPSAGITTVSSTDTGTGDITPQVGITGTPVIDRSTNTLYVVSNTDDNGTFVQQLHALDLSSGAEKFGGPVTISFSTPGSGYGSSNGEIGFNALIESQRAALALNNNTVYIAWASHGDNGPYHGLLAAYDASNLQLESVLNVTPNNAQGGIWMGGDGPAIDSAGNIFLSVGNGTFDNNGDWGDSILRIVDSGSSLSVADSFTPFNQQALDDADLDFGSGGVMLLPTQAGSTPDEAISGGKDGNVYLVNRDDMGGFNGSSNSDLQTTSVGTNGNGVYDTPAYFNGDVYINAQNGGLEQYPVVNGLLTGPSEASSESFAFPGATPSISSDGAADGIVWEIEYGSNATLHAYDASNVSDELYNSNQAGTRDQLGLGVKFAVPTVANGHIYVGTATSLDVFGLLNSQTASPPAAASRLTATSLTPTEIDLAWTPNSTDAAS
ncbi:MAG TPA: PQQ-binding-like beta-propeller repeat protein, partial [Tepidisphaeraceae bacterium]|nr:PQQ-binding-like beta-propeller repeat protein [Tepidisphaeraceae bacterium]